MKIDRTNYEIWFIDWLDGNLSEAQTQILNLFLNENPDKREELNQLGHDSLKPSGKLFPGKEKLRKSTADLSSSQFEYLCAAKLENDLSSDQLAELDEIIQRDPEKKHTFGLIQKTKLTPPSIYFKNKYLLRKRTTVQRIIRLSVIGLSAAAVIAITVISYNTIPRTRSGSTENITQNVTAGIKLPNPVVDTITKSAINENKAGTLKNKPAFAGLQKVNIPITGTKPEIITPDDSLRKNNDQQVSVPSKILVKSKAYSNELAISPALIASNLKFTPRAEDNGRSNIGRFIARTFREKILREKTSADTPLRGYEVAEAGVTGLNKLLGWEMALDKRNDEDGNLRSVYFSSRILKFNAPVKKTEPLP